MDDIFIGLGSNLGDRELNLSIARGMLASKIEILSASSIHETKPEGMNANSESPYFLNQVIEAGTTLSPSHLLKFCLSIEDEMGRKRVPGKVTSRIIDIDILFYGKIIISNSNLTIPHPRIRYRIFVLGPLMEIAPDFVHPLIGKSISELYNDLIKRRH